MNLLAIIDYYTYQDNYLEIAYNCAAKTDILWFRIKNTDSNEIITLAMALRNLLPNKILVLSERADIASICSFDGVHLNSSSLNPKIIKENFPNLKVGYSAHSIDECFDDYCDYFTLSPIFSTPKNYPVKPLGLLQAPNSNVYALGGINENNYKYLENLGYKGIAGIRICTSDLKFIKK